MATATLYKKRFNPAHAKRKNKPRKNKARRHLTAKQIRAGFGGARRKAAMKANRPKHHKATHRKAKAYAKRTNKSHRAKKQNRRAAHHRARTHRQKNPGEILSMTLPNPGGRRRAMAKSNKKNPHHVHHHKKAKARRNPGRSLAKMNRRHHRRNAGAMSAGNIFELLQSGVFAAGGLVGSRLLTQAVLGSSNTGPMGYAGNAAATAVLAILTHMVSKNPKNRDSVILGGVLGMIARAIQDYTPLGTYFTQAGFGDYAGGGAHGVGLYLPSNQVTPMRLIDPLNSAMQQIPQGWGTGAPVVISSGSAAGVGMYAGGGDLY